MAYPLRIARPRIAPAPRPQRTGRVRIARSSLEPPASHRSEEDPDDHIHVIVYLMMIAFGGLISVCALALLPS
jgi:hypothetical protein